MKELLDKLSSYNIFNYLLPGVIFSVLAEHLTRFKFIPDDIVVAVFVFYFVGQIVSRIGSLVIDPALKKISFVKFADYPDYIKASKKDTLIESLSEVNNSYRTYISLFLLLIILKAYDFLAAMYSPIGQGAPYVLIIGLLVLFLFSYRKQTQYVAKRVARTIKEMNNQEP
jgi:hypothetical protein